MSNHPNMSYCMFQNTNLAMQQINGAIVAGDEDPMDEDCAPETEPRNKSFFERLSEDEQRAFKRLVEAAKLFIEYAEQENLV